MADGGADPRPRTTTLPTVYVDTSVPSYLTARRARTAAVARNQLVTCLWWNAHRARFSVFASARVLDEARRGNRDEVRKRIAALSPLPSLTFEVEAAKLAKQIMRETRLPDRAEADAEHVAIAATNGIDYLVTWNCKHLANRRTIPKVVRACERGGFRCPEICTPEAIIRRVVYGQSFETAR